MPSLCHQRDSEGHRCGKEACYHDPNHPHRQRTWCAVHAPPHCRYKSICGVVHDTPASTPAVKAPVTAPQVVAAVKAPVQIAAATAFVHGQPSHGQPSHGQPAHGISNSEMVPSEMESTAARGNQVLTTTKARRACSPGVEHAACLDP